MKIGDIFPLNETIEFEAGKWIVYNKSKTKVLGTHDTKEEAKDQLAAIEISKKKNK